MRGRPKLALPDETIVVAYQAGKTAETLAADLGCATKTILNRLRACGITLRRAGKRQGYTNGYKDWTPRFWANVDKNGPVPALVPELGPCWLWTAGTDSYGYGLLRVTRLTADSPATRDVIRAHRLAYFLEHGELPTSDFHIRHLCDNEACVRGSHIAKGTPAANAGDRVFSDKTMNTMLSRQEWDESSLYDSNSRVTVYVREKVNGKWTYRRLDSAPTDTTANFYLRYTSEGKRAWSTKISKWSDVVSKATELQQALEEEPSNAICLR